MNTIVVDDRQLAVNALISVLKEIDPNGSHAGLIISKEAISYAKNHPIDVAFLDIEMPDINGLILAKELKDIQPRINIVFVTGHIEYSYEAHAGFPSGFLLKPAEKEDILKVLENLRHPIVSRRKRMVVRCFGNFEVFIDDTPVVFKRSKSKELFAYLIDNRGAFCTMGDLISTLWESGEATESRNSQVRIFISDIRKTLEEKGFSNIILKEYNAIAVKVDEMDCDYFRFLERDMEAVNQYAGEYMRQYSWAEMRIPELMEYMDDYY